MREAFDEGDDAKPDRGSKAGRRGTRRALATSNLDCGFSVHHLGGEELDGATDLRRTILTTALWNVCVSYTALLHALLRHAILSPLAMLGSERRTIQELAGHHAPAKTERYLHLQPSANGNAMALLDAPPPARLIRGSVAAKRQRGYNGRK